MLTSLVFFVTEKFQKIRKIDKIFKTEEEIKSFISSERLNEFQCNFCEKCVIILKSQESRASLSLL